MQGFSSGAWCSAFSTPSCFPCTVSLSVCLSSLSSIFARLPPSPPLAPVEAGSMHHTSLYKSPRGACQASRPLHCHVNSCSAHRYAQDEPPECGRFVRARRGDYKLADSVFSIMECSLRNLDRVVPQRIIPGDVCVFAQVCGAAFLSRVAYTCWPGGLHTQIKHTQAHLQWPDIHIALALTHPLSVPLRQAPRKM